MSSDPQLVHDLPLDVFRYVLETAALLHRPTAKNLALVSRTVHNWINPIMYQTIVLEADINLRSFARCIRHRCDFHFLHANVKTLCITHIQPPEYLSARELEDVHVVLSTCTGIINLALWTSLPRTLSPFFPYGKIDSRPKYMSFLHLPPNDIRYVLPPSLTHLDFRLEDGDLAFSESTWNTLFSLCPNLTTLILDDDYEGVTEHPLFIAETVSSIFSSPRDSLNSVILRPSDFQLRFEALLNRFNEVSKDSRIVIVPSSYVPNPTIVFIERKYLGMVFFLPEVTESKADAHEIADWTFPMPAPHNERLWERVEKWKQGGRRPTVPESFDNMTSHSL